MPDMSSESDNLTAVAPGEVGIAISLLAVLEQRVAEEQVFPDV